MPPTNIAEMPSNSSTFVASLNTVIKKCRDILRLEGITGMDSMKHLTLYTLLRRLDITECRKLKIPEQFSWENFMNLKAEHQRCFDLLYCKNGATNDLISCLDTLFGTKNFNFKLSNPTHHVDILNEFKKLDFSNLDGKIDILGTIYEIHLGSGSNKSAMRDLGQFFTERDVCKYMTALCNPKILSNGRAESVLDPTMGTGGFLSSYIQHLGSSIDWSKMHNDIAGYDIDEFVMSIGKINLYLQTGQLFERIERRDTLKEDIGTLSQCLKFKNILANMPFGVKGLTHAGCCLRVRNLKIQSTKSEPLFLQLIMTSLDDGGRCAVVVPDGVLVNTSKGHNETRKYLLEQFELKRVIKMNGQFFSNTGIQPSILFFENTGKPTSVTEFWEVEKNSAGVITETLVVSVPREKIDTDSYSLDMRRYVEVTVSEKTSAFPMVKLSDICVDISTNKNIPSSERKDGNYRFFTCSRDYSTHNESYYEGTYLIHGSRGSTISESVFATSNEKFAIGTSMFISEVKDKNKVNTKYIYYYLKFNKQIVDTLVNSSAIPMISKTSYYTIQILLPPLETQQQIVAELDSIYENAHKATQMAISIKTQMASVMKSVGMRGYERKKIGDVCDLNPENITKADKIERINYIDLASVKEGSLNEIQELVFNERPSRAQRKVKKNDIIWGTTRPLSKSYTFIDKDINNLIVSTGFVVMRSKDTNILLPKFLYYSSTTNECIEYLNNKSTGSTFPAFKSDDIAIYDIAIPPLETQQQILTILNEMEGERKNLEQMASKTEERTKFVLDGYLNSA
jgi:type I restriction enzyme S subunit